MKLFQYIENQETKVGMVLNQQHIDLKETILSNHAELPYTLDEIMQWDSQELMKEYQKLNMVGAGTKGEIKFAPVVNHLEKIVCIGLNYMDHIRETKLERNDFPPVFPKFQNALIANDQYIHLPKDAYQFDYEAELVIVIKKDCHMVSVEDTKEYIFGFCNGNDFSARDLQMLTSQWMLGKSCDDFAPVGPYIVTADECDSHHLDIMCRVNGEIVQKSNTDCMIYNCEEIVSYLSKYMTLKQNDLIFTGTPSGVILGKKDKHWLTAGDKIEVSIAGLGTLTNILV